GRSLGPEEGRAGPPGKGPAEPAAAPATAPPGRAPLPGHGDTAGFRERNAFLPLCGGCLILKYPYLGFYQGQGGEPVYPAARLPATASPGLAASVPGFLGALP